MASTNRKKLQLILRTGRSVAALKQIHAHGATQGLLLDDQRLASKLVSSYTKMGEVHYANKVFDNITEPDIVSYTTLMYLHLQANLPAKSISIFAKLINSGLAPDSHSIVSAICACGRDEVPVAAGKVIHGMVFRCELGFETIVGNALIDMYCRNGKTEKAKLVFGRMGVKNVSSWTSLLNGFVLGGDLKSARQTFDEMPQRNSVAWTAMVSGYVHGKQPVEALQVFKEMMEESVCKPTTITMVAVLAGCTGLAPAAIDYGRAIHAHAHKVCLAEGSAVSNALMDLYSKGGCHDWALRMFKGMKEKDVFSWNTLISMHAFRGEGSQAMEVFEEMLRARVVPNDVTVLSVLSACSHGGLVLEAQKFFGRMIHLRGFQPKIFHYGCMVDVLGRAGLLAEAKELVDNMPMEADAIIWRSILGSCITHGNLMLAEIAGKKIMELEPLDDGVYVLLWNIYCGANRQEDALKMRKTMSARKVKKRPAWSCVPVDGVIHKFVAEDATHHATVEIHTMLAMMAEHLKWVFDPVLLLQVEDQNDKETDQ